MERFHKATAIMLFPIIIILGIDDMVPYLIQQLRRNAEYKNDIVVLTVEDTKQVRLKFRRRTEPERRSRLVIPARTAGLERRIKSQVHKAENCLS